MKTIFGILFMVVAVSGYAKNYQYLNCPLVKGDAKFGAELARGGDKMERVLEKIAAQEVEVDSLLKQSGRKAMSIEDKIQMKLTITEGYYEALRQKDATVEQIAASASFSCMVKKYH